ncbi:MAG: cache domain-containing protein [Betaproteobacteria bacterium]|nr:cache domain-containing protein [Betaproteobacteria bacterium]
MHLRLKVLILAVAPLLLAIAAVAAVIRIEARALADAEAQAVQPVLLNARKAELQHYVYLAQSAIAHLRGQSGSEAREEALRILSRLDYGEDGYFFVYDFSGRNLMHPRQPDLVGQNLWNLRDAQGQPMIQQLIEKARAGGGFVEYLWQRPSTRKMARKLGYVVQEPQWGWMLGTGIYLDDIEEARARIDREATRAIEATLGVITGIAVVAALIVAIGGLALNLSDRRDAEIRMRALARQVVRSQETERARVAHELHDGVNQLFVSAKLMLESAQERADAADATLARPLTQALERLNEGLREIRRISHGLRPALLDDLGLIPALNQIVSDFSVRTGIASEFETGAKLQIPNAVATALFRVTQEALTNIERHAQAHRVRLQIKELSGALIFAIGDDGIGFDFAQVTAHPRGGLGLSSMQERIETLGGDFDLQSGPGGTTITARFPAEILKAND